MVGLLKRGVILSNDSFSKVKSKLTSDIGPLSFYQAPGFWNWEPFPSYQQCIWPPLVPKGSKIKSGIYIYTYIHLSLSSIFSKLIWCEDTNLLLLRSLLGIRWQSDGWAENAVAPGAMLIVELDWWWGWNNWSPTGELLQRLGVWKDLYGDMYTVPMSKAPRSFEMEYALLKVRFSWEDFLVNHCFSCGESARPMTLWFGGGAQWWPSGLHVFSGCSENLSMVDGFESDEDPVTSRWHHLELSIAQS